MKTRLVTTVVALGMSLAAGCRHSTVSRVPAMVEPEFTGPSISVRLDANPAVSADVTYLSAHDESRTSFVKRQDSGGWREEHEWPLARTDWQKWYLHSNGDAPTSHGDGMLSVDAPGDEPPDRFDYDPDSPAPTIGGNTCCWPEIVPWGPMDQRPVEERPDVLCYSSPPLETDMEVTGPITVTLYASSSAPDTDFTAKLVDVYPFGCAVNIVDGIVRARYREGPTEPSPIEPGRVYEYRIDLGPTANVFRRGHRIRLEVSSSNFPHYDRNPNTGHEFGRDAEVRVAEQTVLHSEAYCSHVVLPVMPAT